MEYQVKDGMSFMRFLELNLLDNVPDATTLWWYRQALTEQGLLAGLFERFNGYLSENIFTRAKWIERTYLGYIFDYSFRSPHSQKVQQARVLSNRYLGG